MHMQDRRKAFTSLHQQLLPWGTRAVLGATANQVHVWLSPPGIGAGPNGLSNTFSGASGTAVHSDGTAAGAANKAAAASYCVVLEAPQPSPYSVLQLYRTPGDLETPPARFAWLCGGVLYDGRLDWDMVGCSMTTPSQAPLAAQAKSLLADVSMTQLAELAGARMPMRLPATYTYTYDATCNTDAAWVCWQSMAGACVAVGCMLNLSHITC